MSKLIKGGVLGGIILFIWGAVSWMLLPWHMETLHTFKNESMVTQAIQANADISGVYFSPLMPKDQAKNAAINSHTVKEATSSTATTASNTPHIFASIRLDGMANSMTHHVVISFITQLIAAFFVAWLLLRTTGLSYIGRLVFVIVFALAAGTITHIPYWNWFGFDAHYTLVEMADLLIGWFLAGLVMAAVCNKRYR